MTLAVTRCPRALPEHGRDVVGVKENPPRARETVRAVLQDAPNALKG